MNKLFWIDRFRQIKYSDLICDLSKIDMIINHIWMKDKYQILLHIIHSMVFDYPIILYDSDFSREELNIHEYESENFYQINKSEQVEIKSLKHLLDLIQNTVYWRITLLTSGTTGIPQKVTHDYNSITKACKISEKHKEDIWGFAYNPTHMAGIQVFFQAFLNGNTMIDIFGESPEVVHALINKYNISHISATPTFYRLILSKDVKFHSIKQASSGGEKLTEHLKERLFSAFPNARISNIYASTEAGSLLASDGETFRIPDRFIGKIKVIENEIVIHKSLLGNSDKFKLTDNWYYTGDMVEIVDNDMKLFKFLVRKNNMINIGGYKVNPEEVEEALLLNPKIHQARVYGKPNPVLGNILCADIVAQDISERDIRRDLNLQNFKIPRIIYFKDTIDTTRTGKVKR
jgi:acyl-coenzyme A synthetase/AMP-(fatty) acid ligase